MLKAVAVYDTSTSTAKILEKKVRIEVLLMNDSFLARPENPYRTFP
jgi:hypothetical protein